MKYRVRTIKPRIGHWRELEAATPFDAAQDLHLRAGEPHAVISYRDLPPDWPHGRENLLFSLIEVEGEGTFHTKSGETGLRRRGGLPPVRRKLEDILQEIAGAIDWLKDPAALIKPWEGEETYEDVRGRQDKGKNT